MALRYAGAEEWTYADYARLPADGRRYEIHEGVLCMPPSPATLHQLVVVRLGFAMHRIVSDLSLGIVFVAPYDVVLSDVSIVQPDVVFVSAANKGIVTEENIGGAPDLVVEVLSPGTKRIDRGYKRSLYERSGGPEYWIVDPAAREVTLYSQAPGDRRYPRPRTCRDGDTIHSIVAPELAISLTEVWS